MHSGRVTRTANVFTHFALKVMKINDSVESAHLLDARKPVVEERSAMNRHQTLWPMIRKRFQPGAQPGRKENRNC